MWVWPIGYHTSRVHAYWPLWDEALLRRFWRAYPHRLPMPGCLSPWAIRNCHPHPGAVLEAAQPTWRRAPLVAERPNAADDPPPQLDLLWPSDEQPQSPRAIVIERPVPEPYPVPGTFIDLIY